ncbi:hypothetical protein AKJ09_10773 [Labilithrix luteola]|uniref:Uncharacterized protein n=1 Tax=Labilithrix luteola TaxID=1391654 RepID=A0A0K1QF97_9BACT|nr:hypothetical protein AKJ09_10773 [Labilithrix luteola]
MACARSSSACAEAGTAPNAKTNARTNTDLSAFGARTIRERDR